MEERLHRIEEKLDRLLETQVHIQLDVAEHIRRTEIAEDNIKEISKEIKPIQEHVAFLRGLGKLVMATAALSAAIASVYQLFIGG